MIYNRGTTGSYAEWARLVNDSSWTFEQWLPYFVKGIHYNNVSVTSNIRFPNSTDIPLPADAAAYNSTGGGPVQTSYPYSLPFSAWVQGSFRELEFPDQQDFISGHLLGSQYASVTVDPSTRMRSYSRSYLDLALASPRTNLQIYSHTLAKKVLFANGTRATGVRVVSGSGAPYDLTAKSEVILSAGAFQSPQLLMVSGVGPRETLEKYNISVIADRPGVGQGMQDHLDFGPTYQINVQGLTAAYSENNANAIASYIANRTGIFTSPGVEYIGWEKVPTSLSTNFSTETLNDLSKVPSDWPDLEYECAQTNLGVGSDPLGIYATVLAILVAPTSRGNVTIISNDTSDLPIINPNWLTTATDEAVAIAGFKRARQLFNTAAIQPIIIGNEVSPGSNVQSDEQILDWIRETAYQNWHASCTCRMGIVTDPMAVVDSKARVIGVSRLRVVDASAFALLPPGHPQSTVCKSPFRFYFPIELSLTFDVQMDLRRRLRGISLGIESMNSYATKDSVFKQGICKNERQCDSVRRKFVSRADLPREIAIGVVSAVCPPDRTHQTSCHNIQPIMIDLQHD